MTETGTGLTPAVELLWGLRPPGRRGGPKPALSLDRIVAAAIELADAGGLAALSMSRLAEKLGFTTMSLYRYVTSKDELLLLVLDAAIGDPPDPEPDAAWRPRVQRWADTLAAMYHRHPWALELPISALPAGPNQLLWFDRGLAALESTRLTETEKASSALLVASYVRTNAQLGADLTRAAELAAQGDGEHGSWATVLMSVITRYPDRYPAVSRAVAAGIFGDAQPDQEYPDDEFDFGLQRVLDGIESLHHSRR